MEGLPDFGFEVREDFMISPAGGGKPTRRLAHFLQPSIDTIDATIFELPSHCLSSIPSTFEPKKWPLNVQFHGWRSPQRDWKIWAGKMAALHESTWKKAEKWCPETKSFVFPWGEATITLEDVMISGYSVLGSPVFSRLETDEMKETEEKLSQARKELCRSSARKAEHCNWMKKFMDSGSEIEHEAFLVLWLSRFVIPSSFRLIVKSVFPIAIHLAKGNRIALAPAILASIYRDLSLLKEKIVSLAGIENWENEGSKFEVTIMSPFHLVQIWGWERFIELRPVPNLIKTGEARFAQWHRKIIAVENVRTVLDSAKDSFVWRPYAKAVQNKNLPKSYGEKKMRESIDDGCFEELESFARCLKISELVGIDCIEQYLPHRVAMQFGMDQDLPTCVARANDSPYIAWSCYSKPISYEDLYILPRLCKADVTTRYLEWWNKSLLRLQSVIKGTLPQKRILTSAKKGGEAGSFSASIPFSYSLKSSERSSDPSELKKRNAVSSASLGLPLKKAKKNFETSKEKKETNDISASAELASKILLRSLLVKKEANDALVPPGFPPKSNLVAASNSTEEDNLMIVELLKARKKDDGIWNGQVGFGESLRCQSETISSIAECEGIKVICPQTESVQKRMQNEPINVGSETAMQDSTESKVGSPAHDMGRIQGGEGDGDKYASEVSQMPTLQLEDWVSRLERKIAELKAARFGHKTPVLISE
ncbi:Serine/threonine-protein phosphatase 7 long form like [Melia azedarach]|uniref:Serine/threonine-protein phosphatase 7 long form like n=1 Tax=Melia azedarach TaxID=155640 RepID=A0ACC1YRN0_MELAZ|nr:Serine/threonine-protein phosphatase 7 long form like [Melia azedarach]